MFNPDGHDIKLTQEELGRCLSAGLAVKDGHVDINMTSRRKQEETYPKLNTVDDSNHIYSRQ